MRIETYISNYSFKDRFGHRTPLPTPISTYQPYQPIIVAAHDCQVFENLQLLGYQTEIVSKYCESPMFTTRKKAATKMAGYDLTNTGISLQSVISYDHGFPNWFFMWEPLRHFRQKYRRAPGGVIFEFRLIMLEHGPAEYDANA